MLRLFAIFSDSTADRFGESEQACRFVLVHIRSIDDKSYKVTEINNGDNAAPETQVETDMAEDEVKKFEEDWTNLWNLNITKNDFEKLHR